MDVVELGGDALLPLLQADPQAFNQFGISLLQVCLVTRQA
jgi:hypothetical protein